MKTQTTIRVRWESAAGYWKAVSMEITARQMTTSTSSAERAVRQCAGKVLACREDEVMVLCEVGRESRPVDFTRVTTDAAWTAFECVKKGSVTQTELFNAGGAS